MKSKTEQEVKTVKDKKAKTSNEYDAYWLCKRRI